jgi:hypothetical protein
MMPTVLQLKDKKKNRKSFSFLLVLFWECIRMCTIVLDFFSSWNEAEEIKLSIYELKLRLVEVRQKKIITAIIKSRE